MPVKSLLELATTVCQKHVKQLDSVGDYLPYSAVQHLLQRVENAPQLRQIELNSPQIQGETGELWLRMIEKDFPLEFKAQSYKPQDPTKWYKVWEKYKKTHDRSIAEGEKALRQAFTGLKEDRDRNTSRVVERKDLVRGGLLRGRTTRGARGATPRIPASGGKNILHKARREAQEISRVHGSLTRPAPATLRSATVSKAPSAMVDDYRRAAQPSIPPPPERASPVPSAAVAEHERRAQYLSDSDADDGGGGSFDHGQEDHALPQMATKRRGHGVGRLLAKEPPKAANASSVTKKSTPSQATSSPIGSREGNSRHDASTVTPKLAQRPKVVSSSAPRSGGMLARKFNAAARLSRSTETPTTTQRVVAHSVSPQSRDKQPQKVAPVPQQTQASPPKAAAPNTPLASPPPAASDSTGASSPNPQPRKRKAVDIFMRPKKR